MGRRDPDPRPEVELWGVEAAPQDASTIVQVGGRRSRRAPLLAAVAAVALLAGGLALGGDDQATSGLPREERDNRMRDDLKPDTAGIGPTTTRPATTTTSTTTTTFVPGPVLPAQTGAALLLSDSSSRWIWFDLDTGRRLEVEMIVTDPYGLTAVSGGIVGLRGNVAEYHPLPVGIPVSLGSADAILSSGSPDSVWLLRTTFEGPTMAGSEAVLVDLEGNERSTVSLPAVYPVGGTDRGLVFSRGGRTYVADESGIQPLALGDALRTNRTSVVVLSCDDQAECAPEIVDIATGRSRRLAPMPIPYELGVNVLLSEAGELATVTYEGSGQSLHIYDAAYEVVGTFEHLSSQSDPRWLPNGLGLVATGYRSGGGVVRLSLADGDVVAEPIPAFDGQFGEFLYVIPR